MADFLLGPYMDHLPPMHEHDFVISTDGSGCQYGWGSHAAIIRPQRGAYARSAEERSERCIVGANYGMPSCVARNEFEALLSAMFNILHGEMAHWHQMRVGGGSVPPRPLSWSDVFKDERRIRVMWYSDRADLVGSFVFDERGATIARRMVAPDLWGRYQIMAPCFCLTPVYLGRNSTHDMTRADALCGVARTAMKNEEPQLQGAADLHKLTEAKNQWTLKKNHKKLFW